MSVNRRIDKENVVHIYNAILVSCKKEQHNAICNNMDDLEFVILSEVKSDTERQILYDVAYMWNLKKKKRTYLQTRSRVMDVKNKLMVTRISKGGINGETGIDIYILLYIQQITNNFLSSTGKSTQYSTMAYMGKESKKIKEWTYI